MPIARATVRMCPVTFQPRSGEKKRVNDEGGIAEPAVGQPNCRRAPVALTPLS